MLPRPLLRQWEALPTVSDPLLHIFAYHFPPSPLSGAARPGRWARYLPEHGIRCRVTAQWVDGAASTESAGYVRPEDVRGLWRPALSIARAVHRLAPYNDQWPWLPAALRHAFPAHAETPAQAVLSTFPPLAAHMAGLLFHLRTGRPWIADFRDPLAGNPFRCRAWGRPYDQFLEALVFRHAAAVLVTNDAAAARYRERYPHFAAKVHVLWNGFDPAEPAIAPRPAACPRRIVHAGWLYGPRRPASLLRAMALLLDSGKLQRGAWRIVLIGPLQDDTFHGCEAARDRLTGEGMLEVRGGIRPRSEMNEAMAQASILLLLDLTGQEQSVQVPAKLFEYVRTGLPVAAWSPAGSPARQVLERSGVASLIFSPDDSDTSVAERLGAWLDNPPAPAQPSAWFLETFDGARQAAWLGELIRSLIAAPDAGFASRGMSPESLEV